MESCPDLSPPAPNDLENWIIKGHRKNEIADETTFCDEKVLKGILAGKVSYS